jgi:hypothetical protein
MAIDPTHRYLACVDQQFQIHAIRIADLSLLQTRPLMNSSIDAGHLFSRLSFDPSGTYLAIYASDLSLTHSVFRILQFFSGVLLSHIPSTHGFVRAIEWADDCTAIITADSSSAITCWHINSKLAIDEMQQRLEKMRYRVAPRSALPADAVGYLPRWLIRLQRGSADESAGIEHSLTSSNDKLRAVYCFPGETVEENDNELDLNISAVPVEPPSPQELRIENDFRFTILSPNEKLQSPFNANFMVDSFTDSLEPALPSDIETQTSPSFNPIEGQIIATQTSPIDAMPYIEALKLETTKPGSPRSVTDSRARQLRRALTNDKSRAKRAEIDIEQTFRMTSGLLDKLLQQSADSGAAVSYLAQLRVKLQTK